MELSQAERLLDWQIEVQLRSTVAEERKVTNKLICLICVAEERKIHLARGYCSMFDWLTQHFKLSEGSANRRISAARLLRTVPETKEKLENGDINLTTLTKAQSVFRAQEKATKTKLTAQEKSEALKKIENQSSLKAEQTLLGEFPEAASNIRQERITPVSEDAVRVNGTMSEEMRERFEKVKDLLSHSVPSGSFMEVVDHLFKKLIKENDEQVTAAAAKQCVKKDAKTVTKKARRIVIKEAEGGCQFVDEATGKRCGSTRLVQVDHKVMRAMGGSNNLENLQCLCAEHNRYTAVKILGHRHANHWRTTKESATG